MRDLDHGKTYWSERRGHFMNTFFEPVFMQNVHVIWPITEENLNGYVREFVAEPERIGCPKRGGKCVHLDDGKGATIILIGFTDNPTPVSVIAHEAFHAVEYAFGTAGLTHTIDASSEAFAYYLGYLVKNITMALRMQPLSSKTRKPVKRPWRVVLE